MNNREDWQRNNDYYLSAAMGWLQRRLELKTKRECTTDTEVAAAERAMVAAERVKPEPALTRLRQQLKLSWFETNLLLLCIAMEWDKDIPNLYALIQGNQRNYPTFYLAFTVLDEPTWDVVSPERPLRKWRLIEIMQSGVEPLITSPLRADERIVNYIKGLNYLDDILAKLVFPWPAPQNSYSLPPSQQEAVKAIIDKFQDNAYQYPPAIELLGPDIASKQLVAWQVCVHLSLELYRLPITLLPREGNELETIAKLWERESLLEPVALYLEIQSQEDYISPAQMVALHRFLERSNGLFLIDMRDKTLALERETLTLDIAKPTAGEQIAAWEKALGTTSRDLVMSLVGQFNLSIAEIEKIVKEAQPNRPVKKDCVEQEKVEPSNVDPSIIIIDWPTAFEGLEYINLSNTERQTITATGKELQNFEGFSLWPKDDKSLLEQLWDSCLESTRPKLENLAQRIDVKAGWEDIVLPQEETDLLQVIAAQVRGRGIVYEEWGFHRRMNRGKGGSVPYLLGKAVRGKQWQRK